MPHPHSAPASPSLLADALDKNETIQEAVGQSAAELCVIHAVLKQEVPDHMQVGDVAQALEKTDELENRIQTAAEELADVNEKLKQEIKARAELEQQLASTRVALAQVWPQGTAARENTGASPVKSSFQ